jgi:uncharacterized protein YceH (UPF0502 family)
MQERSEEKGGALVIKLDRAPGAREQRWAHLLCGPVDASAVNAGRSVAQVGSADLQARVTALEAEVAELRATVQKLCSELGLSQ